jgi:hypothetical protein
VACLHLRADCESRGLLYLDLSNAHTRHYMHAHQIKCPVCRMKFPTDEQLKRHRKNFCVKPSADSAANDAAAAGTTNTEQAASGGPSSPGRAPPAGITRQDLGGFVAAYAVNSKAVISGSSQALSESQKELGALTLEQLKRKMFSSSFADLQVCDRRAVGSECARVSFSTQL